LLSAEACLEHSRLIAARLKPDKGSAAARLPDRSAAEARLRLCRSAAEARLKPQAGVRCRAEAQQL